MAQSTHSQDSRIENIKRFYFYYLDARFDKSLPYESVKDTVEKYCTTSFLKKISDGNGSNYDADPFIHVQDLVNEWRERFTIKNIKPHEKYRVCISGTVCVDVVLKVENNIVKIDNILAISKR